MLKLLPSILLVGALIMVFVFLKRFADQHANENFDERQVIYRQKAYSNAAFSAITFNVFMAIEGDSLEKYFSISFVGVATLFLLVGVFAISSILYDAYFTKENKKRYLSFYLFVTLIQVFAVYRLWVQGIFFHSGQLYLTAENSTSLLFVITFALALLATVYKSWQDKMEEEE